jgi:hypothetical protein
VNTFGTDIAVLERPAIESLGTEALVIVLARRLSSLGAQTVVVRICHLEQCK